LLIQLLTILLALWQLLRGFPRGILLLSRLFVCRLYHRFLLLELKIKIFFFGLLRLGLLPIAM
jgi:hypothetical protein